MTYQDTIERLRSMRLVLGVAVATVGLSLLCVSQTYAAIPTMTATTGDANNDGTVDRVVVTFSEAVTITGADLTALALSSGCTTIASADDTSAVTTMTLTVSGCTATNSAITPTLTYTPVAGCGTAGAVCDDATTTQMAGVGATVVDNTKPVLITIVKSTATTNKISFTYSEPMTTPVSASTGAFGALTGAGVVSGIGSFGTVGNVVNPVAETNGISGSTTATIVVAIASSPNGYLTAASTTEPSDLVTPLAHASLYDAVGLTVNTSAAAVASSGSWTDLTKPTVSTAVFEDTDNDGTVNRAHITFTESVATGFTADKDEWTVPEAGTVVFAAPVADGSVTNSTTHVYIATVAATGITGGATAPTLSFTRTAGLMRDPAGNLVADFVAQTLTDNAQPVLLTATPVSGGTVSVASTSVIVTFSESMVATMHYTTDYTVTPTDTVTYWPDTADVWATNNGLANSKVTFTRNAQLKCGTAYTITMVQTDEVTSGVLAANGAGDWLHLNASASGSGDGIWSFRTSACAATGATEEAKTYTVGLQAPNGGESFTPGQVTTIKWTSGGTGTLMGYVELYYSVDGGVTFSKIASNELNDGSYSWSVPYVESNNVVVKVVGTDMAVALANDVSDSVLSITTSESAQPVTAEDSGVDGLSPVTGLPEAISVVNPGDYIRGSSLSTVYYVDADMQRHGFMDAQTFFTWQSSFSGVKVVTDATLTSLTLGSTMLPKAGVVLVKIQSDPKVYMLETNSANVLKPTLRWVSTEAIAIGLFGSGWANYVIDIEPTMYGWFNVGTAINSTSDVSVDRTIMKIRTSLK